MSLVFWVTGFLGDWLTVVEWLALMRFESIP
jgi:hypothetical protein